MADLDSTLRRLQGARRLRAVTPDDDTDLPAGECRALFVGIGGDINVIAADDSVAVVLPGVAAGVLDVQVKRVLDADTTASGIIAMY